MYMNYYHYLLKTKNNKKKKQPKKVTLTHNLNAKHKVTKTNNRLYVRKSKMDNFYVKI